MILINALLLVLAIALFIPCGMLLLECLSAVTSSLSRSPSGARSRLGTNLSKRLGKTSSTAADDEAFSVAVIMPAHNEAEVIVETLAALTPQLYPQDRLIVVADNCTDNTAQLARKAGAIVIERTDDLRRGKGYALDCGLRFVAAMPPAAVVIVDADCQFRKGSIRTLASEAITSQRPVQGVYLIECPTQSSAQRSNTQQLNTQRSVKEAVSTFAFKVKNLVRPLGLDHLGLPCLLTGTGMAFPWSVMSTVDLASSSIVEDMKLGFDLAIAGTPPAMCSTVTVVGPLPPSNNDAKTQRTRWEHGHLQLISHYGPQLFGQALVQGRLDLWAIALDLLIPPLSLLVTLWIGVTLVVTLTSGLLGLWLPIFICWAAGTALAGAIVAAWARFAQSDLDLKTLLSVPVYVLWKIPVYLKFLSEPQVEWVRTRRQVQRDK
ncbi:MAG: glycosyltransferase [Cyanobacteria bacterium P01_D01_bin.105]